MFDSSQTVIYQLKVVLGISPSDLASPHGNVFKALELIKKLLDNTSILAEHEKKPCPEAKKLSNILPPEVSRHSPILDGRGMADST